ncbi:MAG: hypothetical protein KJS67_01040, partial [Actinomycetales bacterium]|nr:hypothetical protein [Actinomycetales bacterium]
AAEFGTVPDISIDPTFFLIVARRSRPTLRVQRLIGEKGTPRFLLSKSPAERGNKRRYASR